MKLTWLGHSCFLVEQDGYRIVLDPYRDVAGHADIRTEAHEVLCSHGHYDHSAVDGVTLLPEQKSPFVIRTVQTCHDEQGGALRGENTVHILEAGGVSVAHLGDLGHLLSAEQIEAIGPLDAVMIPVGGFYTIDGETAKAVCEALKPRIIIPMHYRHAPHGLSAVAGVEPFLQLWAEDEIHTLSGNTLEVAADKAGVWVPTYVKPK